MASYIAITWFDEAANTTDTYTHEMNDANYTRVLDHFRRMYVEPGDANGMSSKNRARKMATSDTIKAWKDRARSAEISVAAQEAIANVPPIDSTEV